MLIASPTSWFAGNALVGALAGTPSAQLEIVNSSATQLRLTRTSGSVFSDVFTDANGWLNFSPSGSHAVCNGRLGGSDVLLQWASAGYGASVGVSAGDYQGPRTLMEIFYALSSATNVPDALRYRPVIDAQKYDGSWLTDTTDWTGLLTPNTSTTTAITYAENQAGFTAKRFTIDMGGAWYRPNLIALQAAFSGGTPAFVFKVERSVNNSTWTTIFDSTVNVGLVYVSQNDAADNRYFRFTFTLTGSLGAGVALAFSKLVGFGPRLTGATLQPFSTDHTRNTTFNGNVYFASGKYLRGQDGSASAASLSFANETNTGFYRDGAGILGVSTAGTQRARFLSTGLEVYNLVGPQIRLSGQSTHGGGVYLACVNEGDPGNEGYLSFGAEGVHDPSGFVSSWVARQGVSGAGSAGIMHCDNGVFTFYADGGLTAGSSFTPTAAFSVSSTGIGSFVPATFAAQVTINGSTLLSADDPRLMFYETNGPVDGKYCDLLEQGGNFSGRFYSDNRSSSYEWLTVTRNSSSHTANTISLQASNLLDINSSADVAGVLSVSSTSAASVFRLSPSNRTGFGLSTGTSSAFNLSFNAYYDGSAWVHNAPAGVTSSAVLQVCPGAGGVKWYLSSNSSASWNLVSGLVLWNDSGIWTSGISTSGTALTGSNRLLVGATELTTGSSAVAQFNGLVRMHGLIIHDASGVTPATDNTSVLGTVSSSFLNVCSHQLALRAGDGKGLRFWDGSTNFQIYMSAQGASGAGRMDSTSDYNMYFRMTGGTNRGFVFQGGAAGTTNLAQIDATGKLFVGSAALTGTLSVTGAATFSNELIGWDAYSAIHSGTVDTFWEVNQRLQSTVDTSSTNCMELEVMTPAAAYGGVARVTRWQINTRGGIAVSRYEENGGAGNCTLRILSDNSKTDTVTVRDRFVVGVTFSNTYQMAYMRVRYTNGTNGRWSTLTAKATSTPTTVGGSSMTYSGGWVANTGYTTESFTENVVATKFSTLTLTGTLTGVAATLTGTLTGVAATLSGDLTVRSSILVAGARGVSITSPLTSGVSSNEGGLTLSTNITTATEAFHKISLWNTLNISGTGHTSQRTAQWTTVSATSADTFSTLVGHQVYLSVGNASGVVTSYSAFVIGAPAATGTITTHVGLNFADITSGNVTSAVGIYSAMGSTGGSSRYFIKHDGVAPSLFNGLVSFQSLSGSSAVLAGRISGNSFNTLELTAGGTINFGSGSGAADTNLYRVSANLLGTDDSFYAGGNLGVGTTSPEGKLHVNGRIHLTELGTNPAASELTSSASYNYKDRVAMYMKSDKLVIAYNNSGVVTYISIPMDGTTTTWTHSTTAP